MSRKLRMIGVSLGCVFLLVAFFAHTASCDILEEVFKRTAYVELERVFEEYEKKKDLELELERESQIERDRIREMSQQLTDLRNTYERQEFLLTEEARKARQQEIMEKMTEVETLSQKISDEIKNKQFRFVDELLMDIKNKIGEVAKKEGYMYVFDSAAIIYGASPFEITERIISELNNEYRAKKR